MTEVLVDAVAQMVRNIANFASRKCEAVGLDAVKKVQFGVNVRKYDQPDITGR